MKPSKAALKTAEKINRLAEDDLLTIQHLAAIIDEHDANLLRWFKAAVETVEGCQDENCPHCSDIMPLYNENVDEMRNHQPTP